MLARIAWVLFSAGLHALAFSPWAFTPLAWVALVPLLVALHGLPPWRGALLGLLWGSAAIWCVAWWVPGSLIFYYQQPWWFGVLFCVVGSAVLWGSYYALYGACAAWICGRCSGMARVLLLALLWIACELARASFLTGEPWMLLGYALVPLPAILQIADAGGIYALSFVAILVNASLAEVLIERGSSPARRALRLGPALAVVLAALVYGRARLAAPLAVSPQVAVEVVQGNNAVDSQWREGHDWRNLESYLRLSLSGARRHPPALIVWPESAVTFFLAHERRYQASIARLLEATGADLITGAPHYERTPAGETRFYNSAFYATPQRGIESRYDKRHLLPFAEYFPLRMIHFLRRRFERVRTFSPGEGEALLQTRFGPVAVVVCFEAVFPEIVRERAMAGARLLVILSNDVWLGAWAGPEQHLAMTVVRAVESRLWTVRATTTGISAIVDPLGRIVTRSETGVSAVLDAQVVPLDVATPYERWGDAFAYACTAAALLGMAALAVRSGVQRRRAANASRREAERESADVLSASGEGERQGGPASAACSDIGPTRAVGPPR